MAEVKNGYFILSNTEHWHLVGNVYGDKRFYDGMEIVTSRIISLEVSGKNLVVTTKNSKYLLRDYEKYITTDMIKALEDSVDVVL